MIAEAKGFETEIQLTSCITVLKREQVEAQFPLLTRRGDFQKDDHISEHGEHTHSDIPEYIVIRKGIEITGLRY